MTLYQIHGRDSICSLALCEHIFLQLIRIHKSTGITNYSCILIADFDKDMYNHMSSHMMDDQSIRGCDQAHKIPCLFSKYHGEYSYYQFPYSNGKHILKHSIECRILNRNGMTGLPIINLHIIFILCNFVFRFDFGRVLFGLFLSWMLTYLGILGFSDSPPRDNNT